jgi:hypothetical protein
MLLSSLQVISRCGSAGLIAEMKARQNDLSFASCLTADQHWLKARGLDVTIGAHHREIDPLCL